MIFPLLAVGVVFLYFGAEALVKGGSNIASRLGIPSLVIGLTIVAFGTSAPEMVVSLKTGLSGQGGVSIGNVVGSNIFNIAVILGLSSLVRPLRVNVQVLRIDTPILVLVSGFLFLLLRNGQIGRLEGGFLLLGFIVYTVSTVYLGKRNQSQMPSAEAQSIQIIPKGSLSFDLLWVGAGLGGLILGAHFFVTGAVELAIRLRVSPAVIGLTIVAMGTSLPELATSIVAAVKKQEDIAIGNIIGSNIFNILAILGLSGSIKPLQVQGVTSIDLLFMTGTAILLVPLMRTKYTLSRLEGLLFLTIYGLYFWYLWPK